jgi:hypothetical protein
MEPVSLLIGIIAGGVVASTIWIIANVVNGNKGKAERTARNSVISSIGEHIAGTDSLLVSFSAGVVSGERLKGQIIRNIEAIQSLYKPNLHLFDVFYTKYIDTLVLRYTEYVKSVSTVVNQPTVTIDHFAEAAAVAIEQQPTVTIEEKVVTPSPMPGIIENVSTQSIEATSPVVIEPVAIEPIAIEPVVEEEKEISEIELSSNTESAKVDFDSHNDDFSIEPIAIEPVSSERTKVLPVEDADIPQVQMEVQDITSIDDLQKEESAEIASASMPQDQEAEISFEAMAQDVMSVEDEIKGRGTGFQSVMNDNVETQAQHVQGLVPPNSDEEEFAMETIMDLDMSKIPSFNAGKSNITIKSPSSKPLGIEQPLQDTRKIYPQSIPAAASGSSIKTPGIFAKQPVDQNLKVTAASAPVTTNLETSQTEPVVLDNHDHHHAEKDNYGITGDDIADQMDSFFGIGK